MNQQPKQSRLNKFISSNSSYSRRKADELIQTGKVLINGKKAALGTQVDPTKDKVSINGKTISPQTEKIYLALNKPDDYVTTRSDDLGRKTVMSLVPNIPNIKPVGRLDKDSEGLLLFSNDGDFINKYTHPKFECEKEYFVRIKGILFSQEIQKLENGIIIDNRKTYPAEIKIIESSKSQTTLTIKIHEGRNRQIRNMFASLGHDVKYLQRIRIGKILLGSLEKGKYRTLTSKEINAN